MRIYIFRKKEKKLKQIKPKNLRKKLKSAKFFIKADANTELLRSIKEALNLFIGLFTKLCPIGIR